MTLKAEEVRLGNHVLYNGVAHVVDRLIRRSIRTIPASNGMTVADYDPIPLTEERLKEFGFERVPPRSGVASSFIKNGIRIDISNSGNAYYKMIGVPYVHRLQNLYFALRDEELTLKEG